DAGQDGGRPGDGCAGTDPLEHLPPREPVRSLVRVHVRPPEAWLHLRHTPKEPPRHHAGVGLLLRSRPRHQASSTIRAHGADLLRPSRLPPADPRRRARMASEDLAMPALRPALAP